jgi:hypothetical protein
MCFFNQINYHFHAQVYLVTFSITFRDFTFFLYISIDYSVPKCSLNIILLKAAWYGSNAVILYLNSNIGQLN